VVVLLVSFDSDPYFPQVIAEFRLLLERMVRRATDLTATGLQTIEGANMR
jgi:hypothetical protein